MDYNINILYFCTKKKLGYRLQTYEWQLPTIKKSFLTVINDVKKWKSWLNKDKKVPKRSFLVLENKEASSCKSPELDRTSKFYPALADVVPPPTSLQLLTLVSYCSPSHHGVLVLEHYVLVVVLMFSNWYYYNFFLNFKTDQWII